MTKNQKKLAVLLAVQASKKPISLPNLLFQLGSDFAERSVRRWLNELIKDDQIAKMGKKRGTYYQVTSQEKIIHPLIEREFLFSKQVDTALQYVEKPLFQRNPVTYSKKWIDAYQPNHTFYLTEDQRKKLKNVGKPELNEMPAGTYARKIYDRLMVELSYNSSRLEGNTYSLGDTEKLILEGIDTAGKLTTEKLMILNHKEAIRYLVDNAHRIEINFNSICTLHYLLSDNLILTKDSGKMRDHSVKISSSTYIPLDDSTRLKNQLNYICGIAKKINDPHEQSFFLLVHIAYLQAFSDVNKRTARLSANIPLIRYNLYPIAFHKISKDDYISAMIVIYELNDPRALAELYTFSYLYTAQEYNVLMHSMGFDEVRIRFRKKIREIIRNIILKKLFKQKMEKYIKNSVIENIPAEFQLECINTIHEDLKYIGPERIHGFGITQKELTNWLLLQ